MNEWLKNNQKEFELSQKVIGLKSELQLELVKIFEKLELIGECIKNDVNINNFNEKLKEILDILQNEQ